MRMRIFYGAVLLLPLFASAQKQQPPIPAIGASIEVSIVNVDVFVTRQDGQRVRGLTKDDFEIFENGKLQPISNFSEYAEEAKTTEAAQPAAPAAAAAPIPPQPRTIIFFFDRFYLPKFRNDPLFASLRKLVHDTVRPGDRAMIVTWNRGVLFTMQDFTDSVKKLDKALDGVQTLSSKPLLAVTTETKWQYDFAKSIDDAATAAGVSTVGDSVADMELLSTAQHERYDLDHKIRTISALIRSIAGVEGKKILVLATHRLSRDAGAEHYYAAERPPNGPPIPSEHEIALDMRPQIKKMEETANANGVTIYPIYPEGLQPADMMNVGPSFADYQTLANETPMLTEVAEETGGLAAWGDADVVKLMPHVTEDLGSYYSLAYKVQNSGEDKERKIVVKVKRPGLVVRSRREFMEKSDTTRMEDRVIAALFRIPPSVGTIPLNISLGQRRPHGKQYVLPVTVHIPVSALTALPQGNQYAGAFSVYFAWGGVVGGISDTKHETKSFRIPIAEMDKARNGHLTYEVELNADNRTDRVALGVVDDVSKEFALRLIELRR
jgi:VWFA-related protein